MVPAERGARGVKGVKGERKNMPSVRGNGTEWYGVFAGADGSGLVGTGRDMLSASDPEGRAQEAPATHRADLGALALLARVLAAARTFEGVD